MDTEGTERGRPWERMAGEHDAAWSAFQAYLQLGPGRSIREVAKRVARSKSLVHRWSIRFHWIGRCAAWDSRLSYAEAEAAEKVAVKAVEREARRRPMVLAAWRKILRLETAKWLKRAEANSEKTIMPAQQLAAVVDLIERTHSTQGTLTEDAEDRKAIDALLAQLRRVRDRTARPTADTPES